MDFFRTGLLKASLLFFLPFLPFPPSISFGVTGGETERSAVNEPGKRAVGIPGSGSWLWLAFLCVTSGPPHPFSRPQPEGWEATSRCLWGTSCLSFLIRSGLRNCPGMGPSPQGGGVSEAGVLTEPGPPRQTRASLSTCPGAGRQEKCELRALGIQSENRWAPSRRGQSSASLAFRQQGGLWLVLALPMVPGWSCCSI